jgi:structural maintenance of chromosome 2
MGMIEKAEGEYTELLRKRKVVENDKKKIESVIEELDVKKKSELQRTWRKVNKDFGSIFSTLLPGASAKLEPPEGMEAWEGLEVKVAFGEVWKESLSELSGGQRSLLALSLILSLLLFKPAPMYILDEVDAALDLSHTQNIGNMLRTHFSQSQFIVVSLKEGMFNNANVIFRTKFVDGVSTVNRHLGTGSSSRARELAESNEMNDGTEGGPTKRQARPTNRRGKENSIV